MVKLQQFTRTIPVSDKDAAAAFLKGHNAFSEETETLDLEILGAHKTQRKQRP